MLKLCIYCGERKKECEFSLEHIFPDALGGKNFHDSPFKTSSVCRSCNTRCGSEVDAPFINNIFSNDLVARSALMYFDPKIPQAMPMRFFGTVDNFYQDKCCDIWFGIFGGQAYHVYDQVNKSKKYDGIHRPANKDKSRAGSVYIGVQSTNFYWNKVFLLSCKERFKKARWVAINFTGLTEQTETDKEIVSIIQGIQNSSYQAQRKVNLFAERNFLSKLALGIGFNLLGESFLTTDHGQKLRQNIREPKNTVSNVVVRGKFNGYSNPILSRFKIDGVHFLSISSEVKPYIMLELDLFGMSSEHLFIVLSNDESMWQMFREKYGDYLIYLIAPWAGIKYGGLNLLELIVKFPSVKEDIEKHKIDTQLLGTVQQPEEIVSQGGNVVRLCQN